MHQAAGLGQTVVDMVKGVIHGNNPLVSIEERDRRLQVCYACDQLDKLKLRCFSLPGKPGYGCKMSIKAILSVGKCPQGKW